MRVNVLRAVWVVHFFLCSLSQSVQQRQDVFWTRPKHARPRLSVVQVLKVMAKKLVRKALEMLRKLATIEVSDEEVS